MKPLAGIRVIDLTTVLMGPLATQMLGEMGADVVKVEPPGGDVIRAVGPARHEGMGALFLNANRYKRSICLDLKRPAGREALLALLTGADVLAYNLRPRAMARLGLDRAALAERYPRLIHAGMVGFAEGGPYANRPAYDDLIQGGSGLAALLAAAGDGTPRYVPAALADRIVGIAASGAICAALLARERTGVAGAIEIPMFETLVSLVLGDHLAGLSFEPPLPGRGYGRLLSRARRPYPTRDGHVCAMIYTDRQWADFLALIGQPDLARQDPRFADFACRTAAIDHVYGWLETIMATRTTAEWLAALRAADIPVMPMHDLESLLADPHLAATGFFRFERHPSEGLLRTMAPAVRWEASDAPRPAPRLGEHGRAVLAEAGLGTGAIDALLADGALRLPDAVSPGVAAGRRT